MKNMIFFHWTWVKHAALSLWKRSKREAFVNFVRITPVEAFRHLNVPLRRREEYKKYNATKRWMIVWSKNGKRRMYIWKTGSLTHRQQFINVPASLDELLIPNQIRWFHSIDAADYLGKFSNLSLTVSIFHFTLTQRHHHHQAEKSCTEQP